MFNRSTKGQHIARTQIMRASLHCEANQSAQDLHRDRAVGMMVLYPGSSSPLRLGQS